MQPCRLKEEGWVAVMSQSGRFHVLLGFWLYADLIRLLLHLFQSWGLEYSAVNFSECLQRLGIVCCGDQCFLLKSFLPVRSAPRIR